MYVFKKEHKKQEGLIEMQDDNCKDIFEIGINLVGSWSQRQFLSLKFEKFGLPNLFFNCVSKDSRRL